MRHQTALIIGGGPAGTAAATLLAAAGAPHLLIERTRETGNAICGGFLSWRSLESLRAIGIDPALLNSDDITDVRLFHRDKLATASLPHPAKGVSRYRLDTVMMAHAIATGARVERGGVARSVTDNVVQFSDGSAIQGESLLLATGKYELRGLARPAEARGTDPSLGIRVLLGPSPALTRLVGQSIELHLFDRGYAGLSLQEDGSANLCMAVHRSRLQEAGDPEALLIALAAECPPLADRLAWRQGGTIDAIANVPYGWRAMSGTPGLFRLGDQAGVIPSLAGEGMGIAIASGIRAAQSQHRFGPRSAVQFQRRLARDLSRPIGLADMIRAAAESPKLAGSLLALAGTAPKLVDLAARLTRINHSPVDANAFAGES